MGRGLSYNQERLPNLGSEQPLEQGSSPRVDSFKTGSGMLNPKRTVECIEVQGRPGSIKAPPFHH